VNLEGLEPPGFLLTLIFASWKNENNFSKMSSEYFNKNYKNNCMPEFE
jgi:hypothetical protein